MAQSNCSANPINYSTYGYLGRHPTRQWPNWIITVTVTDVAYLPSSNRSTPNVTAKIGCGKRDISALRITNTSRAEHCVLLVPSKGPLVRPASLHVHHRHGNAMCMGVPYA